MKKKEKVSRVNRKVKEGMIKRLEEMMRKRMQRKNNSLQEKKLEN